MGSKFPVSKFFRLCLLIAARLYVLQSGAINTTSGCLNSSGKSSSFSLPISQCIELGNCSSQSIVKHSHPLLRNSFEIHSVPENNSNSFNNSFRSKSGFNAGQQNLFTPFNYFVMDYFFCYLMRARICTSHGRLCIQQQRDLMLNCSIFRVFRLCPPRLLLASQIKCLVLLQSAAFTIQVYSPTPVVSRSCVSIPPPHFNLQSIYLACLCILFNLPGFLPV